MPDVKPHGHSGLVYFIGAGTGPLGHLTLDGRNALEECRLVFAFDPYPETFAPLLEGREVLDPFQLDFAGITGAVEAALARGDSVAFLVPGDTTVFSPFFPLIDHFGERARVLPGVGVVNAAAALLGRTLEMPPLSLTVVLASPKHLDRGGERGAIGRLAALGGTLVLYMVNRPVSQLAAELAEGRPPDTPIAIVYRVGLPGQRVYRGTLETIAAEVGEDDPFGLRSGEPSLGLVIVGAVLEARGDPSFWDHRKRHFWDRTGRP